jgi:hypothetical protein
MKAGLIITGSGALIYLTSHKKFMDDALIKKLETKGIEKFIVFEVPVEETQKRYGGHFDAVITDLKESDDLRILDYEGCRAFRMFSFKELGEPMMYEKGEA